MVRQGKKDRPGRLRIVAGKWRSRLLDVADVEGLRPTSARIRETLFNWLQPTLSGARCLDLCAGTGALGIEALSRGASSVVFVEQSPIAESFLRKNLAVLGATEATVLRIDARHYLESSPSNVFDVVFLDPPFAAAMHDELCQLLENHVCFGPDARIYLELDRNASDISLPANWQILKEGKAGNVRYTLVARKKTEE